MTQRRKKGKAAPNNVESGAPIGGYAEGLPPPAEPESTARNDDYYRGRRDAMAQVNERAEDRKAEEARMEEIANSRISVEFGDGTVTFRDGLDRIIRREALAGWATNLGALMAERNCSNIGCRMSEHALFTARGIYRRSSAQKAEATRQAGGGPGMHFQDEPGRGSREMV